MKNKYTIEEREGMYWSLFMFIKGTPKDLFPIYKDSTVVQIIKNVCKELNVSVSFYPGRSAGKDCLWVETEAL